ncbi:LacI family DNA-binding transcriptional regulator [Actinomycetes bacterium KLBMP 9797]
MSPHTRPATLDDVAKAAGVSRSTASRVIAGYGPVSTTTRERVATAAARLRYAPNPAARALVTGAGFRLVVAVLGPGPEVLHDGYVDRVVSAAATVCAAHDVGVVLRWVPLSDLGVLAGFAEDRGVRGVLLINATAAALAAVPARLAGRIASIGIGARGVPAFDVDNGGATTTIVQHLYATGRRRIAMLTGPRWMPCAGRSVAGYRSVMTAAGLPVRLVPGEFSAASGRAGVVEALRRWPDTDAVYAISDAVALGALAALRERGIQVPGDLAVAGFDDIPFAGLSAPALTTATHPVERIITAAATAVLTSSRIPPETAYPSRLVLRESA